MANIVLKTREFLAEVGTELKKSSWPTRKELMDSTVVVIITMLILGVFVAVADYVFLGVVGMLMKAV